MCMQIHTHTHFHRQETCIYKCANTHNRKSVNEWEGAGGRAGLCWWKIWLLSTSAFLNTHSYLPSPQEERSFLFSFLLCITVLSPSPHLCFPLLLQPFLPSHLSTPLLSFYILPPFIFSSILPFKKNKKILLPHSTLLLAIPSFLLCSLSPPMLSVEKPIQQQNKAAYSITHWLIKQDQNSAALRSTQQHHDSGLHWRGEVSHIARRRGSKEKAEEGKYTQDNITCYSFAADNQ